MSIIGVVIVCILCFWGFDVLLCIVEKIRNKDLYKVVKLLKQGRNVFITGGAGTGKSYMLKKLGGFFPELKSSRTATTGVAALNIDGVTIHSWTGIGIGKTLPESIVKRINSREVLKKRIQNAKMLIIDEISMLQDETFILIDEVMKKVRDNSLPFGGIQLIVVGDFCQLPPVTTDKDTHFCFCTDLWKECNFEKVVLTKIYRQEDKKFAEMLNKLRFALGKEESVQIAEYFRNNVIKHSDRTTKQKQWLHIYPYNKAVFNHNQKRLKELEGKEKVFKSDDFIADVVYKDNDEKELVKTDKKIPKEDKEKFDNELKAEENLVLKRNCRVMLIYNLQVDAGLVNGALGTVVDFIKKRDVDGEFYEYIKVRFDNKKAGEQLISKFLFEVPYNSDQSLVRKQFPLILAYSMTIHKVQGLTLSEAVVSLSGCWENGQAYVALSRVRTSQKLKILNSIKPEYLLANPDAVRFSKE